MHEGLATRLIVAAARVGDVNSKEREWVGLD